MLVLLLVLGLGVLMLICVIGLLALLLCGGSDQQDQWQVSENMLRNDFHLSQSRFHGVLFFHLLDGLCRRKYAKDSNGPIALPTIS